MDAPPGLTARAKKLYLEIADTYGIVESSRLALLELACIQFDVAHTFRRELRKNHTSTAAGEVNKSTVTMLKMFNLLGVDQAAKPRAGVGSEKHPGRPKKPKKVNIERFRV